MKLFIAKHGAEGHYAAIETEKEITLTHWEGDASWTEKYRGTTAATYDKVQGGVTVEGIELDLCQLGALSCLIKTLQLDGRILEDYSVFEGDEIK